MMFRILSFFWGSLFALFLICPDICLAAAAESKAALQSAALKAKAPEPENTKAAQEAAKTGDVVELSSPSSDNHESLALTNYNRVVFHFNDTLDKAILKPIATLYNKLIPRPLHKGITNIFSNIDNIPTVVNDVLQVKVHHTFSDAWRLIINTTVGIGGLFDVASRIGLKPHHEDFGLTLARWGYTNSSYFVVPFFGPGTIRDVMGWPVDYFFFSIYPYISNPTVRYSVYGLGVVDRRSNLLQYQDVFEQVAVDRYVFMRDAYLQHRKYQIDENNESTSAAGDDNSQPVEQTS